MWKIPGFFMKIPAGYAGHWLSCIFIILLVSGITAKATFALSIHLPDLFQATENTSDSLKYSRLVSDSSAISEFQRIEFGVQLPAYLTREIAVFFTKPYFTEGINPYDPEQIDLYAIFRSPSGKILRVNGFFFRDFMRSFCTEKAYPCWEEKPTPWPWRIRFSPDEPGVWKFVIHAVFSNSHWPKLLSAEGSFQCTASMNKGYINVNSGNMISRGRSDAAFPLLGLNTDWYRWGMVNHNISREYQKFFSELHLNGANLASLSFINRTGLQIEWEHLGVYESVEVMNNSPDYNANRQAHAWEVDQILALADTFDIFLKFNFLQHADFGPDFWNWSENPYHTGIPSVIKPMDFFTDSIARKAFRNKLRYMIARWGYSTQIAWYELATEIDNIEGSSSIEPAVLDWFNEMSAAIKGFDNRKHLISGSYATHLSGNNSKYWVWHSDNCDLVNLHAYGENKRTNFDRYYVMKKTSAILRGKPILFGEIGGHVDPGVDEVTDRQFRSNIWATTLMSGGVTGLYWHWEAVIPRGYLLHYKSLSQFVNMIDWADYPQARRFPKFHGITLRGRNYRVENFYRIGSDRQSAIGWIHNSSAYWYNMGLKPVYSSQGHLVHPSDDDRWSIPVKKTRDFARISGLKPWKRYCFTPYFIGKDGLKQQPSIDFLSNIAGQIDVPTWKFFYQVEDFSFILKTGNCNCNLIQN